MTAALRIDSPIGELTLTASDAALTGVFFPTSRHGKPPTSNGESSDVLDAARRQLEEYFSGTRQTFDLPLAPTGTPFQLQVWELLRRIPYGATTSYGALAKQLGDPTASRAVGAANGQNPIPIIVPCHRVIGSNGDLTGFGGGIECKRWLLKHEGALLL